MPIMYRQDCAGERCRPPHRLHTASHRGAIVSKQASETYRTPHTRRAALFVSVVGVLLAPALVAGAALPLARASVTATGAQAGGESGLPSLSSDGTYVAFESSAPNLVLNDTNLVPDIFVKNTVTGTVTRASVASDGQQAGSASQQPAISATGRYVAFESYAANLVSGDTNGTWDVFVKDTATGGVIRVSTATSGAEANAGSYAAAISADGRYVAFESDASNLVPGDTNGKIDVFVKDTVDGDITLVSSAAGGLAGDSESYAPAVSGDGRYVAFESLSTNLVPGDTNGKRDVFVKDMQAGTVTRVSVDASGTQGTAPSAHASISSDGRYV
ncbi:MAG: hypothetical protein FDZ75_09580, partial [Actinobacteria bacterium]